MKLPMTALLQAVEFLMNTVPYEQVQDMTVEISFDDVSEKLEMSVYYNPSKTPKGVGRYGH
jgi:hypothetical protein